MLERPELRQLAQRVVARYHLGPLTKAEVAAYVRHRLDVSGATRPLFPARLMGRVYALSGGIPRVINVLCDRALLGAYVQGKERIDRATLAQAAREVFHQPVAWRGRMTRALLAALVLVMASALAWFAYRKDPRGAGYAVPQPTHAAPAVQIQPEAPAARFTAALPETLEWPQDESGSRSTANAYAALFRAWGADYQGGDACQQAEALGLHCRTARGGLHDLRQFNRPAVLQMRNA